ncbi:MAG: glycogen/starch synthase [Prevotellamassilia sp.]|nr:glycogen/starch synthase [Prevotellamassilia sp.]
MAQTKLNPSVIFETSWEVCNKVGGIYTVLSSRANTLQQSHADKVFFIGPDVWQGKENPLFKENKRLLTKWKKAAAEAGVNARIGRWNVPGAPIAILVDFQPFFDVKNDIYAEAWDAFQVDSLHAYGDYDEASMFSYAAGKFVEAVVKAELLKGESIIYQAHEWMSGLGMLFLKKECPEVATIFTTHATSIGRSIAGNNKLLYKYFHGYNGDQMAAELSMEAKHSIEKQSAHGADCFTTVSMFTDRECKQLLDKPADVVLPNGFENDFVPKGAAFTKKRKEARQCILNVASKLIGEELDDTTLIVSTSGRNDFRCKGFDVYMEALAQLNARMKTLAQAEEELVSQKVLALIEVPCWTKEPRQDLLARLNGTDKSEGGLHTPMITHDLHNLNEDRILCLIKQLGLWNTKNDAVKVILVPCYLEGADGIFNMPYYDLLTANDLCLYPSYYEPWGYTPLESCAFKAPCITTDLSGFGQWVNDVLGYQGELSDGVKVIHRDDDNYFDVSREMCEAIEAMMRMPLKDRATLCKKAAALADKAQWKNFIKHYFEAYDFALRNK